MSITIIMALLLGNINTTLPNNNFSTYTNSRYGYTTCYPTNMRPLREADNGDGRVFRSADGAQISIWGENNYLDESIEQHAYQMRVPGEKITYQVIKSNWVVQSGTIGSSIFWRKTYLRDDQFITIKIVYPITQKVKYNPLTTITSSCFKIGKPAY